MSELTLESYIESVSKDILCRIGVPKQKQPKKLKSLVSQITKGAGAQVAVMLREGLAANDAARLLLGTMLTSDNGQAKVAGELKDSRLSLGIQGNFSGILAIIKTLVHDFSEKSDVSIDAILFAIQFPEGVGMISVEGMQND